MIDLMEELRRRMRTGAAAPAQAAGKRSDAGGRIPADLDSRSKEELYELAKDLEIEGRSSGSQSFHRSRNFA